MVDPTEFEEEDDDVQSSHPAAGSSSGGPSSSAPKSKAKAPFGPPSCAEIDNY